MLSGRGKRRQGLKSAGSGAQLEASERLSAGEGLTLPQFNTVGCWVHTSANLKWCLWELVGPHVFLGALLSSKDFFLLLYIKLSVLVEKWIYS